MVGAGGGVTDLSPHFDGMANNSSERETTREQPPRPNAEISVRRGVPSLIFEKSFLENRYLFGS